MGKVTGDDIYYKLVEINNILGKQYVMEHPVKERDWRNYEKEFSERIRTAMMELEPLVNEAVSLIHISKWLGHPYSLLLEQKVNVLLIN
jgi:hypothetical protein